MPVEPVWLDSTTVTKINGLEVAETGEPFQVLDAERLESACMRPRHLWFYGEEGDVVTLAVSLLYGIAKDHPFAQGNKRTALTAAITFIEANGYTWIKEDEEELGFWVLHLVTDEITEQDLAGLMRPHVAIAEEPIAE